MSNAVTHLARGALVSLLAGSAVAQPPATTPPAPPSTDKPATAPAPSRQPPTLDELLGLTPENADRPADSRDELDRKLAEEAPGDLFQQAIALMGDSAKRLSDPGDPGLQTQRVQEEALRKLDQLISSLERRQQQQQQPQQQQQNQEPQDRGQANQQQTRRTAADSTDSSAQDLPGRRDGQLRPGLEAAKAAWGALPARIREMLLQGQGETFSKTYEKMTEDYYKKLAEQRP